MHLKCAFQDEPRTGLASALTSPLWDFLCQRIYQLPRSSIPPQQSRLRDLRKAATSQSNFSSLSILHTVSHNAYSPKIAMLFLPLSSHTRCNRAPHEHCPLRKTGRPPRRGLRKSGSANFVMLQTFLWSSSDWFGDVVVMGSIIMDKGT